MKEIYLIGFRGTGFRDPTFALEPALIHAGHVGIGFEGYPDLILGFHPTAIAIEQVGGEAAAIAWLKSRQPLEGYLQDDYAIIERAAELANEGARTAVWQLSIKVSDDEFERIYMQAMKWYNEGTVFIYSFPFNEPVADRDNCATFPRRLGLPLLDPVGQIKDYVQVLEVRGEPWEPKEE